MAEYPVPNSSPTIFNATDYPTTPLTQNKFSSIVYFNDVAAIGSVWTSSSTTHTISQETFLETDYSVGELTVYAKNELNNLALYKVFLSKLPSVVVQITASTKISNLTTFTVTNSGSDLLVTTSPATKICWLYIGI